MELTYRQAGDYLLPNIQVPDSPKIGKYGICATHLKKHRKRCCGASTDLAAERTFNR